MAVDASKAIVLLLPMPVKSTEVETDLSTEVPASEEEGWLFITERQALARAITEQSPKDNNNGWEGANVEI